jgi:hypothetical protein
MAINWDKFDRNIDVEGLNKDIEESKNNNGGNFDDIPTGTYEVKIDKMELKESSKGDPMVSIWFRILAGKFKNSIIFYNQVINQGFQIHLSNEFLRSLDTGVDIPSNFSSYKKYNNLIMDVAEEVDAQKLEYELEYGENKKGFKTFEILSVFEN